MAKKLTKANAAKIHNFAKASLDKGISTEIALGEDTSVEVTLFPSISIAEKAVIVDEVVNAAFIDNKYDKVFRDAQFAKCVLSYMTNIPLPVVKNENGEELTDLTLCQEIVYSVLFDSSYYKDINAYLSFVGTCEHISGTIDDAINSIRRTTEISAAIDLAASGKLAQKVLDLYDLLKREISDLTDNPSAIMNLINNIPEDNLDDFLKNILSTETKDEKQNLSVVK